jgi:hypothetical protein
MIKYALPVAALYFAAVTAAFALPASSLPQLTSTNDIVQVGNKGKGKGHGHKGHGHYGYHHHHGHYGNYHRYNYHGRYWGHRYAYRPYGWQTMGCIAAGPVWYCP